MSNSKIVTANGMVDLSNSQPERNTRITVNFPDNSISANVDGTVYYIPCKLSHYENGRSVPVGQRKTSPERSGWTYKFDVTSTGTTLELKGGNERTIAKWNPNQEARMWL